MPCPYLPGYIKDDKSFIGLCQITLWTYALSSSSWQLSQKCSQEDAASSEGLLTKTRSRLFIQKILC